MEAAGCGLSELCRIGEDELSKGMPGRSVWEGTHLPGTAAGRAIVIATVIVIVDVIALDPDLLGLGRVGEGRRVQGQMVRG